MEFELDAYAFPNGCRWKIRWLGNEPKKVALQGDFRRKKTTLSKGCLPALNKQRFPGDAETGSVGARVGERCCFRIKGFFGYRLPFAYMLLSNHRFFQPNVSLRSLFLQLNFSFRSPFFSDPCSLGRGLHAGSPSLAGSPFPSEKSCLPIAAVSLTGEAFPLFPSHRLFPPHRSLRRSLAFRSPPSPLREKLFPLWPTVFPRSSFQGRPAGACARGLWRLHTPLLVQISIYFQLYSY